MPSLRYPRKRCVPKLIDKGITHVVVPSAKALPFSQLGRPLFEDEAYSLIPVADK